MFGRPPARARASSTAENVEFAATPITHVEMPCAAQFATRAVVRVSSRHCVELAHCVSRQVQLERLNALLQFGAPSVASTSANDLPVLAYDCSASAAASIASAVGVAPAGFVELISESSASTCPTAGVSAAAPGTTHCKFAAPDEGKKYAPNSRSLAAEGNTACNDVVIVDHRVPVPNAVDIEPERSSTNITDGSARVSVKVPAVQSAPHE